jgi:hypothetical protein
MSAAVHGQADEPVEAPKPIQVRALPEEPRHVILLDPTDEHWKTIASRTDVVVLSALAYGHDAVVNDAALEYVSQIRNLKALVVLSSEVTDRGVAQIAKASGVEAIVLYNCNVSDDGLQLLSALKNLKIVGVVDTNITRTGADQLSRRSPGLTVEIYDAEGGYVFDSNGCLRSAFARKHLSVPRIRTEMIGP